MHVSMHTHTHTHTHTHDNVIVSYTLRVREQLQKDTPITDHTGDISHDSLSLTHTHTHYSYFHTHTHSLTHQKLSLNTDTTNSVCTSQIIDIRVTSGLRLVHQIHVCKCLCVMTDIGHIQTQTHVSKQTCKLYQPTAEGEDEWGVRG